MRLDLVNTIACVLGSDEPGGGIALIPEVPVSM